MRETACRIPINDNHPLRVVPRAKKLKEQFPAADVVSERHAAARAGIDLNVNAIADLTTADVEDLRATQQTKELSPAIETLLSQVPAGIIMAKSPSGEVVLANTRAKQILQCSNLNLRGFEQYSQFPVFHLNGCPYAINQLPLVRSIRRGEVVIGEELRYRCPDGTFRVLLANSAPLLNEAQTIVAGVLTFHDITDLRAAQEELLRQSNDVIHELAGKLITAQDEERERIARDLHDDLAQRLGVLYVKMGALQGKFHPRSNVAKELTKMKIQAKQAGDSIRQISHNLHNATLILGLPRAASSYCGEFSRERGIGVKFTLQGCFSPLSESISLVMFRVLQEALNNSAKHSGADQVEVALSVEGDELKLRVSDHGVGFDPKRSNDGLGLISMRERLRLIGGRIKIASAIGTGTEIEAIVPAEPHSC